jgi:hypothetical protein
MEAMVKRCENKPQKNTVCAKVGDRALNDLQQVDTGNVSQENPPSIGDTL